MTLFPWKNELVMVERGSVLLSTYKTNNMEPCKLTFSSIAMIMIHLDYSHILLKTLKSTIR